MYLLIRSNPAKKDSIHYTLEDAQALQKHLSRPGGISHYRPAEKTEIHQLTVDRDSCGISFVESDLLTVVSPS